MGLRQVTEQDFDLHVTLVVVDHLVVIQDQDNRGRQCGKAGDQDRQQRLPLPGHEH